MKKQTKIKKEKISIYIPESLLKRLKDYAKKSNRSLNNYIISRLDGYIVFNKNGEELFNSNGVEK